MKKIFFCCLALLVSGCSTMTGVENVSQKSNLILHSIFTESPSARVKVASSSGYIVFSKKSVDGKIIGLVVDTKKRLTYSKAFLKSNLAISSAYTDHESVLVFHTEQAFEDFLLGNQHSKALDENMPSTRYLTLTNSGINFADVTVYSSKKNQSNLSAML